MPQIALWEPEIPPNTGNIARLCAATDTLLHLVGRLGFRLDDASLKRAGCDYWPEVKLCRHATLEEFEATLAGHRLVCLSAHAVKSYTQFQYQESDVLMFGSESRGLPATLLECHAERTVTIPMPTRKVRSLNLATAVGIVLYESLRQLNGW